MPFTRTFSTAQPDAEEARAACEYGPLATRRKRVAAACRCAGCALGPWTDPRVRKLLELGRSYADRGGPLARLTAALSEADDAAAEAGRLAAKEVWSLSEGRRAGEAAVAARVARTVADGVRWALGARGEFPPVPAGWAWLRRALAASEDPPACDPRWLTNDVLALARLAREGRTDVLPILADALQDAGCDDERLLGHCRAAIPHSKLCWVPDLILDGV